MAISGASLDNLDAQLAEELPGVTRDFRSLSDCIDHVETHDDSFELRLNRAIDALLFRQVLVGTRVRMQQIIGVVLTFHDDQGDVLLDDDDQPIEYTSNRHDLGHLLDILHQGLLFAYVKCIIKLQPNSNLNPDDLFFHFAHSSSPWNSNTTFKREFLSDLNQFF